MSEYCDAHREISSRTDRNEKDIQDLWKSVEKIRTWITLGMASVLLQALAILFQFVTK